MPSLASLVSPICVLLSAVSFSFAQPYDWPQWLGPQRNGLTQETGLFPSWPAGGPPLRWLFRDCGTGYAGPAVADGRVYILGGRGGQCQLIALDAEQGNQLWAAPVSPEFSNDWGDGPRSTPTVDGDHVYALSAEGTLICVRRDTGREVWRTTMAALGGKTPFWGYSESVLVDGNKVLCTPGGSRGAIAALDKATGRVVWQATQLTEAAHYSSIVRATFNGEPQYVQLMEKRVVGISPTNGQLLWQAPFPGSVAVIPTPIIDGNRVFVTAGYGAGCMLVEIGLGNVARPVYANKTMKNQHGGVIRLDRFIYGYSDEVGWLCLDAAAGRIQWRERDALGKGAIGYADGKFYCVDEVDGEVVLIDASPDGWRERGRFKLEPQSSIRKPQGRIWVHPVIAGGKLLLRDQEFVYCYDVKASR